MSAIFQSFSSWEKESASRVSIPNGNNHSCRRELLRICRLKISIHIERNNFLLYNFFLFANFRVPKTSHATTTSSAGVQDYAVLYGSYKKSASRTTSLTSLETSSHRPWQRLTSADDVASKGISRPSHSGRYSYQEDNSKLLLEPSALKQSRESIQRFEN